jgi:membrane-associated protease RseP (regulator of RpoE activity)
MSTKRILIAAAMLSLVAGAADAQTPANPPQNPAAHPQGSAQGMMGNGQMMGQGGMKGSAGEQQEQQAAKDRGTIGIFLAIDVNAVGAPGRLIARRVVPYSPAYYAGIASGDQIVAVDGQPVKGKALSDIAMAIRGEVGTPVKLSLSRQGQAREVSLTRVEPVSEHEGHGMSGHGHMGGGGMMGLGGGGMMGMDGGMMGGRHQNGSDDEGDGQNGMMGMMGHMGGMGRMMEGCSNMMQNENQPPNNQFPKHSQSTPND